MKKYETVHRVGYAETDKMAIVHHSNYIRWFEMARVDMMRQMGYPYSEMEAMGIWIPVIDVNCQYKTPCVFDEEVIIRTWVSELKGVSFHMSYEVVNKETGELRVTGTSGHAITDPQLKPLRLKKQFPDIYEKLLEATE